MNLKTFLDGKGVRAFLLMLATWLVLKIPQWIGGLHLSEPWDAIVSDGGAFVVFLLRYYVLDKREPSIDARTVQTHLLPEFSPEDQAKIIKAQERA